MPYYTPQFFRNLMVLAYICFLQLFGAFSTSTLRPCEHFYGTGECFLFTFVNGFKTYKWTGKNMFCARGDMQGITIGTGR